MCLRFAFTVFLPPNSIKSACEERDDDRNLCHDSSRYLNIYATQTPWENTSLSGDFFFKVQR
jgi:hypothetical protein